MGPAAEGDVVSTFQDGMDILVNLGISAMSKLNLT
jgi:hypothetical protein